MKAHVSNPTLKRFPEPSITRTPARDNPYDLAPAPSAQSPTASGR
ncbi:hypothetical protein [Streptomyces sp. NBC_00366]